MHQHPCCTSRLRLCQTAFRELSCIHLHQIGPTLACRANGRIQTFKTNAVFGPDIGFQPQRLRRVSQIDRGDVAAAQCGNFYRMIGRRRSAPFGLERHRWHSRADLHPSQIVAIALQHQIDPRARSNLKTFEARRQAEISQPQHRRDEIARSARFIGLRWAIKPRQQFGLAPQYYIAQYAFIIAAHSAIYRIELRLSALKVQRVDAACHPQRQRIGERCAMPTAHPFQQGVAGIAGQHIGNPLYDAGGDSGIVGSAIKHLIGKGCHDRAVTFFVKSNNPCWLLLIHANTLSALRRPMPRPIWRAMSDADITPLTFAIPKGRILDEALPVMARAGVVPEDGFHDKANRSLSFATTRADMRLIRVRAFDVATFVAHGAAQIGIVGSDVIEEFDYADLYAPVDLDIGHCRLSVAEPAGGGASIDGASHVRVATKYPGITRRHFEARGIQAECVKLNGAMELAPSLGLSGRIVDLVSTGTTIKQNGLVETAVIMEISARLIVNRAALKTDPRVGELVETFRANAQLRQAAA